MITIRQEPQPIKLAPQLTQIYSAAFKPPPYNKSASESQSFSIGFDRMTQRQNFKLVVAWDQDQPVGFAFGYYLLPKYGWHKVLGPHLKKSGLAHWLNDAYCLAEMALIPSYWGRRIGGRMHDELFAQNKNSHWLLSTMQDDTTNGYNMYLKRGWENLLESIWVSEVERAYRVMGKRNSAGR